MDRIDEQIIDELKDDGQKPFLTIAKKLNLSPETVRQRYEKMVKSHRIKFNYIVLNLAKLGFQASVFLFIKGKPNHSRKEVLDYLEQITNVFTITELTGNFDFYASGAVSDIKDFYEMIEKLNKIPIIDRVEFTLANNLSLVHSQTPEEHKIEKHRPLI
jgi:DNA-binding Lrp family transcriptional regulator